MKFTTKQYDVSHLILSMLLHYLGKLKIQIICRYSTHMKENANKFHFNRLKLQCLSTINMVFSDEDNTLIKSLYLKALVLLTH